MSHVSISEQRNDQQAERQTEDNFLCRGNDKHKIILCAYTRHRLLSEELSHTKGKRRTEEKTFWEDDDGMSQEKSEMEWHSKGNSIDEEQLQACYM